jgi:hypothetical protein
MTFKSKYGQAAAAPVNILPELTIDLSSGQSLPSNIGKTAAPVHILPELAVDFGPTVPALHLHLTLRPGVSPAQVACDLFRLYAAVNQLDLDLDGAGLLPLEASYEEPPSDGAVWVTFEPAEPLGAGERLARVVTAIKEIDDYPSLMRCEAKVVAIAA